MLSFGITCMHVRVLVPLPETADAAAAMSAREQQLQPDYSKPPNPGLNQVLPLHAPCLSVFLVTVCAVLHTHGACDRAEYMS
jgi:hypothetical protein